MNKITKKIITTVGIVGIFVAILFAGVNGHFKAKEVEAVFGTSGVIQAGTYRLYPNALAATTTNATSTAINVAGAKKVSLFFSRGDTTGTGNTGASTFRVWVSGDDSNYVIYNKLIENFENTKTEDITRVATSTLTGTSTKTLSMDLSTNGFLGIKCVVVETTDGNHTCKVLVEY